MKNLDQVIAGLQIFAKYEGSCEGQHDVIYASVGSGRFLSDEEEANLKELGWFWDEEVGSWAKFT